MELSKKRQLTAVLIAGMALLASVFALHGSLLTRTINLYGLTDASQGMPSTAASAGGFIALITTIFLSGRVSKLTLLKCSIGICAVFLFLLPWMSGAWIFIGVWLCIGIGLGYLDTLLSSCMSDLYQGDTARRMMCFLHLTYGLANVAAPILYSMILNQLEPKGVLWNRLYLFVAGAGFIVLLALVYVTRDISQDKGGVASLESSLSGKLISEMARVQNGILPKHMFAMLFHGIFMAGITTWINRYMEVTLKASFAAYSLSFLFFGVMISRLLMSFLKVSSEDFLSVSGIVAGASILIALPIKSPVVMGVAIFICGLFYGAMIPCILSLVSSHIPKNPMLVTTFLMLSFYLGQAIGPAMTGKLESRFNLQTGLAVCAVFIVLASGCCISARVKKK